MLKPDRWEITQKMHHNHRSIAFWKISESWNPAVAWKVPSMLLYFFLKLESWRKAFGDHQNRFSHLLSATYQPNGSLVCGRDGQVSDLDLPNLHSIEPVVWLHSWVPAVVGARLGQHMTFEELGVLFKVFVFEPCANLLMSIYSNGLIKYQTPHRLMSKKQNKTYKNVSLFFFF